MAEFSEDKIYFSLHKGPYRYCSGPLRAAIGHDGCMPSLACIYTSLFAHSGRQCLFSPRTCQQNTCIAQFQRLQQGYFCAYAQPMRDITLLYRLSLAGWIHKMIPVTSYSPWAAGETLIWVYEPYWQQDDFAGFCNGSGDYFTKKVGPLWKWANLSNFITSCKLARLFGEPKVFHEQG